MTSLRYVDETVDLIELGYIIDYYYSSRVDLLKGATENARVENAGVG